MIFVFVFCFVVVDVLFWLGGGRGGEGGWVGGGGGGGGRGCTPYMRDDSVVWAEDRLVGLVVKATASRAEGPGFESRLRRDFFRGRVIPVT